MGGGTFQGISFEILSMESRIWNPKSDNLTDSIIYVEKRDYIDCVVVF